MANSYAVIDLETTGLSPTVDEIIEIAVITLDKNLRPENTWVSFVQPQGPIKATEIHGITASEVANAPSFTQLAPKIYQLLSGRVLVSHNADFELGFLNSATARLSTSCLPLTQKTTIEALKSGHASFASNKLAETSNFPQLQRENFVCTMEQSHIYAAPGSHSLYAVADRLGLSPDFSLAHRALHDAQTTAGLFRKYWELENAGQRVTEQSVNRAGIIITPASWKFAHPVL